MITNDLAFDSQIDERIQNKFIKSIFFISQKSGFLKPEKSKVLRLGISCAMLPPI